MAVLDYASDDIVIFHGYFGLYVYDTKLEKIIRSVDLEKLNCHKTQGDDYCQVSVSIDGNTVQLHPMSSDKMFVYSVSNHTLRELPYEPMKDSFDRKLVPIEEMMDSVTGSYSYSTIRFDTNEFGVLHTQDGTLGTLAYERGGEAYFLFQPL